MISLLFIDSHSSMDIATPSKGDYGSIPAGDINRKRTLNLQCFVSLSGDGSWGKDSCMV